MLGISFSSLTTRPAHSWNSAVAGVECGAHVHDAAQEDCPALRVALPELVVRAQRAPGLIASCDVLPHRGFRHHLPPCIRTTSTSRATQRRMISLMVCPRAWASSPRASRSVYRGCTTATAMPMDTPERRRRCQYAGPERRTRAGSGDSVRRTRSNYPRRTTAVAPRAPIGRVGCPLSRTSAARAAAAELRPRARQPPVSRVFPGLNAACAPHERRVAASLPGRWSPIASATPMGARAPDAGTGTCPTDPRAQPPTSVLWPASCPTGPCTAGPCCWAMGHPGSALRRPRQPPHICGAIATEHSMLMGGGLAPQQATAPSCPSRGSSPLRWALGDCRQYHLRSRGGAVALPRTPIRQGPFGLQRSRAGSLETGPQGPCRACAHASGARSVSCYPSWSGSTRVPGSS